MIRNEAAINIPTHMKKSTETNIRQYHKDKLLAMITVTDVYKYSFLPRTVQEWNNLSPVIIEAPSTEAFKAALWKHINSN